MEEIFEQFKDKDAFDAYWKEHYVPLTYEDVREAYEDFVKSADNIFFCRIMRNPVMSAGRILWTIFHRRRSSRFRMD